MVLWSALCPHRRLGHGRLDQNHEIVSDYGFGVEKKTARGAIRRSRPVDRNRLLVTKMVTPSDWDEGASS